jgi:hypothetical protein
MFRRVAIFTAIWLAAGAALAQDQSRAGQAVTLLNQVNMARQAVNAHDRSAAQDQTAQALALAHRILQESAGQPQPVLVTMSKDLETTTTYTPVKKLKNGDLTPDRMKHNTSVREVQATGTMQQLDVSSAADRLAATQTALAAENWTAADQDLRQIQESVIHMRVDDTMPLMQAKDNLQLAKARILEGKPGDARMPLRAAAQSLVDFEKLSPGPDAEKADYMRRQMLERADRVHHNTNETLSFIDSWLDQIGQWEKKITVQR